MINRTETIRPPLITPNPAPQIRSTNPKKAMRSKYLIIIPNMLKKKTVGVLCGGLSQERKVSLKTGNAIFKAIRSMGIKSVKVDVKADVVKKILLKKIDVAFIALHGEHGEDGDIQGLLELAGIPYTGSNVLSSALAMNKIFTKKILSYHNIPVPDYEVIKKEDERYCKRSRICL